MQLSEVGSVGSEDKTIVLDVDAGWVQQSDNCLGDVVNRFLFSKAYSFFYIVMIVLNLVLIIWILSNRSVLKEPSKTQRLFVAIECWLNLSLLAEVALKIVAQKKKYFRSNSNLFDFSVVLMAWTALIFFFLPNAGAETMTSNILLVIRYFVQFLRLIIMIKNQQYVIRSARSRVDFTNLQSDTTFPFET